MALPIRSAPVLFGKEAEEFYERWQKSLEDPDTRYPSEERRKEMRDFFRRYELEKLKRLDESGE